MVNGRYNDPPGAQGPHSQQEAQPGMYVEGVLAEGQKRMKMLMVGGHRAGVKPAPGGC